MITTPNFDAAGFSSLYLALAQEEVERLREDRVSRDRIEPKVKVSAATTNQDNFALDGASVVHFTGGSAFNLTGFVAPDPGKARLVILYNSGAGTITLKHNQTSSAANRLFLITAADTAKATGTAAAFVYLSSLWRQIF